MKKKFIVKDNYIFNDIMNNGKKINSKYFTIYYKDIDSNIKFGIAVGKKIGNAVIRNKYKRRIKNIIDNNKLYIGNYYYIIVLRKNSLNVAFNDLEIDLYQLMKKVNNEK